MRIKRIAKGMPTTMRNNDCWINTHIIGITMWFVLARCIYEGMMINIHTQTHMLHNELLRVGTLSFGANHIDIDYFRAFCFDANRKFCLFNVEHYSRPKWIEQFIMCRRTGRNINVKYLHRHTYVSYVVFDHSAATNLVIKWQTIKTTNLIVFFLVVAVHYTT